MPQYRVIPGSRASEPAPPGDGRRDELAGLVGGIARGDADALRTFLSAIVPQLLRVVRSVLGPEHPDLEDVAYEAAYAVVDSLPTFRGEGTVLHFACRVTVLSAMNVRRRDAAQKRALVRSPTDLDSVELDAPNPEENAQRSSLAPIVRELLATLPDTLAEALALHVVLGYTVAEIAQAASLPLETVRSRLRLAKQALRKRVLNSPKLREAVDRSVEAEA
ncbi:MAG TPA: sigma-70 family RNA polymerase sigma factor [Polyangiaceae bacterium]